MLNTIHARKKSLSRDYLSIQESTLINMGVFAKFQRNDLNCSVVNISTTTHITEMSYIAFESSDTALVENMP